MRNALVLLFCSLLIATLSSCGYIDTLMAKVEEIDRYVYETESLLNIEVVTFRRSNAQENYVNYKILNEDVLLMESSGFMEDSVVSIEQIYIDDDIELLAIYNRQDSIESIILIERSDNEVYASDVGELYADELRKVNYAEAFSKLIKSGNLQWLVTFGDYVMETEPDLLYDELVMLAEGDAPDLYVEKSGEPKRTIKILADSFLRDYR